MSRTVGGVLCWLTLIVLAWPRDSVFALLQSTPPAGTSAQTTQYIVTFKDGITPDMGKIVQWFDTQNLGIYMRPLFTVQSVGPSFVGNIPDRSPMRAVAGLQWQPWKVPAAFAQILPNPNPTVPNCSDVSGPVTLFVGEQATWTATFTNPGGTGLSGDIFLDNVTKMNLPRPVANNTTLSWSWTPTSADLGPHAVYCRAIVPNVAECRPSTMVDPVPGNQYTCAGPAVPDQPTWEGRPLLVVTDRSVIPNCTLAPLGKTQFAVGETIPFAGSFSSTQGQLEGEIFLDGTTTDLAGPVQNGNYKSLYFERVASTAVTQKIMSATWTPQVADAGTHTVQCRAWYDGIAECRPSNLVDKNPRFPCAGPIVSQQFTVAAAMTPQGSSPAASAFSTLGETGTPCTIGAAGQCGISNILVCDANPSGPAAAGMCKIPQCVGQQCVSTAPPGSTFVSGELQNVYSVAVFRKEPSAFGMRSTTNVPPTATIITGLLQAFPDMITSVEPDRKLHFQQQPNDPYYDQQWSIRAIGADTADSGNGSMVKIAVIDTGIATGHEDFSSRTLFPGRDYAACEQLGDTNECALMRSCPVRANGYCRDDAVDDNGHGTHIAGIIAAVANNTKGVAGLVSTAQIIPVKVLNAAGETLESWTIEGIVYAVHQGAKVINLSIGGCASAASSGSSCPHDTPEVSAGFKKVLDYALRRGVVVVAAAGNENDDAQWYTPVNYNKTPGTKGKILVVAATNRGDQRASYSNYGDVVDVAAPGGDIIVDSNGDGAISTDDCTSQECILSTYLVGTARRFTDSNYESHAGTSMAAPHVAAAAGLMLAKNPNLSIPDIIETIKTTTDFIATDRPIGGRINVDRALAQVKEASNINYVDPQCDLCGWCNPQDDPKPGNWDSCRSCLYDDAGNHTNKSYTVLGCVEATSGDMVQTVLRIVLGVSGGIAFLAFLFGGYAVMTAAGDIHQLQMGKETIVSALVGLFTILFSVFILRLFGVTIFQIPGFS